MKVYKKYKIVISLIVSVFLFISCRTISTKSDLNIIMGKMIEISKEDGYSDYMYVPLFKNGDAQNELVCFDIDELRRLYFGNHITNISHEFTFEEFAQNIIENKINLGCSIFGECFMIDKNIKHEYQTLGFNAFKEKYTREILSSNRIILNVKNLERQQTLSILYYFFINSYFSYWNGYHGKYYCEKISATDVFEASKSNVILEEL
ncbi:hypothetical protein ACYSNM_12765 [Myroides sp. LJL116]